MYQNGHYGAALLFVALGGATLIAVGLVELALFGRTMTPALGS